MQCLCAMGQFNDKTLQEIEIATYQPSPVPDRIILNLCGDPARQIAVNWRTDNNNNKPFAQIATADGSPNQESNATTIEGITSSLKMKDYISYHHSVRLEKLTPGTKYIYRVGDGQLWSEWMHFTTSKDDQSAFSFIYFGDAQNDLKSHWSRVIREAYSDMPRASFILHAGDLVDEYNNDQEWGQWFYAAGWINGSIPSIATPGNHEYRGLDLLSPQWRPHFAFPENGPTGEYQEKLKETVYYIDYQGTRIICLNTQAMTRKIALAQQRWLEKLLSHNLNRWTIIFHHHPMFASANNRAGHAQLNLFFKELYEKHQVDLVLQGHDHSYARGEKISIKGKAKEYQSPVYVVSVSGPKMYQGGAVWADVTASNLQLYQLIHVNSKQIEFSSYRADGVLYDSFLITKDANGMRKIE